MSQHILKPGSTKFAGSKGLGATHVPSVSPTAAAGAGSGGFQGSRPAIVPKIEEGRKNPTPGHPEIGFISVSLNFLSNDPHPDYVEIAFFDKADKWIYDRPMPGFEIWDDGAAGTTRVYTGVPRHVADTWYAKYSTPASQP